MNTPVKTAGFTANKIQTCLYKFLSEHSEASEKEVKQKIYALGINEKKLLRLLKNVQQPTLDEAKNIAVILECTVDDLIK